MKKYCIYITLILILMILPLSISAQNYFSASGKVKVWIVKDPYTDSRTGPEVVKGPDRLEEGGLTEVLSRLDCEIVEISQVKMPKESEREYGEWNRASITNRTLGKMIYAHDKDEYFIIGLLSGSKSLVGMLAGLQHLGPGRSPLQDSRGRDITGLVRLGKGKPLKVGLVWVDAQASFNTPDLTLEGDMGGMNVAVAAGLCNENLRLQAGLDPPLSTKYIIMAGVRDTNPYEQLHVDNSFIETFSVEDIRNLSDRVHDQMKRLCGLTDIIYIHVDLSVLGPKELPGYPQAVPEGPSSQELSAFLKVIFTYPKAAALGIASMPDEPQKISLQAAYRMISGAIQGVKARGE